jgi:hypothetical protein
MYGGCHFSSRPRSSSASRNSIVLMNHCRLVTISSGRSPFLVELHRVRDRTRLAEQIAALAQLLDDLRARLRRRQRSSSS